MKPIYLEWFDCAHRSGWVDYADVADPEKVYPVINYTTGWVIEETKEYIVVAHTINEDSCGAPIVILKGTIKRRINLKGKMS